jgi:hypothetical protein
MNDTWLPLSEENPVLQYDFLQNTACQVAQPVAAQDSVTFFHGYAWGLVTVLVFVVVFLFIDTKAEQEAATIRAQEEP